MSVNADAPVRLTDQALVAVALAEAAGGDAAGVADLLVGLAAEPDGVAGRVLAEHAAGLARLQGHARSPRLAPLGPVLRWAGAEARPRPAWTVDLLGAALELGGVELADLLAAVGAEGVGADLERLGWAVPADPLARAGAAAPWGGAGVETVGLGAPGADGTLTPEARLALAGARAAGGAALDVLLALAYGPQHDRTGAPPPAVDRLAAAARAMAATGAPLDDHGADAVLAAATTLAEGPITTTDLLRATRLAGGPTPATLATRAYTTT